MEPTTIPEPAGFSDLPKAEQIRYLQALWDHIADRPGEIPVPETHLALAEERLAEHLRDPRRARPAPDVFDRPSKKERGPQKRRVPGRRVTPAAGARFAWTRTKRIGWGLSF